MAQKAHVDLQRNATHGDEMELVNQFRVDAKVSSALIAVTVTSLAIFPVVFHT
jgi:hypothetical protein